MLLITIPPGPGCSSCDCAKWEDKWFDLSSLTAGSVSMMTDNDLTPQSADMEIHSWIDSVFEHNCGCFALRHSVFTWRNCTWVN